MSTQNEGKIYAAEISVWMLSSRKFFRFFTVDWPWTDPLWNFNSIKWKNLNNFSVKRLMVESKSFLKITLAIILREAVHKRLSFGKVSAQKTIKNQIYNRYMFYNVKHMFIHNRFPPRTNKNRTETTHKHVFQSIHLIKFTDAQLVTLNKGKVLGKNDNHIKYRQLIVWH